MNKKTFALLVFLGLCAAGVFHGLYNYPRLPDTVASHFGVGGQPDAWTGREFFVGVYLFVTGAMAVMFVGMALLLPKTPASLINLPNRSFWLSPGRR